MMNYTLAQQQAIQTLDRNLQLIACAGSGKTQVISRRIVELLRAGSQPGEIVAFTFTEKAAGELKDRIDRIARDELGTNRGLGEMYVGTIHGYCLNLLQSPPLYRYLKYSVLNEVQQRLFIDRHSRQSGLTNTPLLNGGMLHRWKDSVLYQQLIGIYYEAAIDPSQVPDAVHAAMRQYRELLHQNRHLDYTSIMAEAVQELETNEPLRSQLAAQVKHVVVDEYQDVNPLQERLVRQLHTLGATVCVVGDDDQTIYQWRGSEITNIIRFAARYPAVAAVTLNENFRSSVGIVESARQVVERNPERLRKRMETTNAQPWNYGDTLALVFRDPEAEAAWIAQKIRMLHGTEYRDRPDAEPRGLTYADFAILLRSEKNDAPAITEALEAAGVPYIVSGMNRLFETPEIRAICAVFYYLGNFAPDDQPVTEQAIADALRNAGLCRTQAHLNAGMAFLRQRKAAIGDNYDAKLYLQRLYLDLLETLQIREETLSDGAGRTPEIIFYNLGKFSQVITDYEQIHFKTPTGSLYEQFAQFLFHQAPGYYPEGWEEAGLARIDAVQISTVHKAKGMQWPAVFVPALRNNRFPSKRHGGVSVWHIIPETSVPNADRYKGTVEDERRLFYVAVTRAERYLFCSWSPVPGNRLYNKVSPFFSEITASEYVLGADPATLPAPCAPRPRHADQTLALTFSDLKYYFLCPYSFKLRFLYGFNAPINQALGYGKSLHDALAEIHAESIRGRIPAIADVSRLVETHLNLPYANEQTRQLLEGAARSVLSGYLVGNRDKLDKLEHVEKTIELKLADAVVVNGRIDLIRRTDRNEWVVVDFKSSERVQAEDLTTRQLQVYALGFEQLTGTRAHLIEVHNLDDGGVNRQLVDPRLIAETMGEIEQAGRQLRANRLPRLERWCGTCGTCDFAGVCRQRGAV
jgi:DNA helicase-2/ATP-dependent DNA helicase PcrA